MEHSYIDNFTYFYSAEGIAEVDPDVTVITDRHEGHGKGKV